MASFMWENSFRFGFPPFFGFIMTDRFYPHKQALLCNSLKPCAT